METRTAPSSIDPHLSSLDPGASDPIFDLLYFDPASPSTLIPTEPLGPTPSISASIQTTLNFPLPIPPNVRLDPSDNVYSAADQEANIRRLHRNSTLGEFPFPSLPQPLSSRPCADSSSMTLQPQSVLPQIHAESASAPPPPKRRRRRKPPPTASQVAEKQRRFLERNRVAASKCRAKRKTEIERLGDSKLDLERENAALKKRVRELWTEVRMCRSMVEKHGGCGHVGVDAWRERGGQDLDDEDMLALMGGAIEREELMDEEIVDGDANGGLEGAIFDGAMEMDGAMLDIDELLSTPEASEGFENADNEDLTETREGLLPEASRKSSLESSVHTPLFSENGNQERSSLSSTPSSPSTPTEKRKRDSD